jgi:hypothetical protein
LLPATRKHDHQAPIQAATQAPKLRPAMQFIAKEDVERLAPYGTLVDALTQGLLEAIETPTTNWKTVSLPACQCANCSIDTHNSH